MLVTLGGVQAQDRLPPLPAEKLTAAQKKAADEIIGGKRGALNGPFIPLLRSPEFMSRLQKTGEYLRYDNALGRKLTEFVILVTSRQWTQNYEWSVHQPIAIKEGVKKETVAAIADGRRPAGMAEEEEIAYDFCSELQQNKSVSDATYARAVKKFGEQGVVDMTGVAGYYSLLAMILNVSRTPPEPNTPTLAAYPK
jgi:4-carboxymuconolactone decarboxylase